MPEKNISVNDSANRYQNQACLLFCYVFVSFLIQNKNIILSIKHRNNLNFLSCEDNFDASSCLFQAVLCSL